MLPITGELLCGTLLERIVRHKKRLSEMRARLGPSDPRTDISYGRGHRRQISVRRERVAEIRRWLNNCEKLKATIEQICELNQDLLRPDPTVPTLGGSVVIEMRGHN
jgi:hypothetical protein